MLKINDGVLHSYFYKEGRSGTCQTGETIFTQGEPLEEVVMLREGIVKLSYGTKADESIFGLGFPGDIFGAESAVSGENPLLSAIALSHCRLYHVAAPAFRDALKENPDLSWQIHLVQSHQLREHLKMAINGRRCAATQRLLLILHTLLSQVQGGSPQRHGCPIPPILSQRELGSLVGVTAVHINRLLNVLERQGLIERSKGWLYVKDHTNLARNAGLAMTSKTA
jgi:CRP-like cAMP-binding protein